MLFLYSQKNYFVTLAVLAAPAFLIIFSYFVSIFLGTLNFALALVPLNAFAPILLMDCDLMVMLVVFLQFENAFAPIVFTFLPMVMLVAFEKPLNALLSIAVIL